MAARYSNCSLTDELHQSFSLQQGKDVKINNKQPSCLKISHNYSFGFCVSFETASLAINCNIYQQCKHWKCHCKSQLDSKYLKSVILQKIRTTYPSDVCSCLKPGSYYYADVISMCCMERKLLQDRGSDILQEVVDNLRENQGKQAKQKELFDMELKQVGILDTSDLLLEDTLNSLSTALEGIMNVDTPGSLGKSSYTNLLARKLAVRNSKRNIADYTAINLAHNSHLQGGSVDASSNTPVALPVDAEWHQMLPKRGSFSYQDLKGLKCKTNKTVNFYFLDYDVHETIVRGLGFDHTLIQNRTSLALVDLKVGAVSSL